MRGTGERMADLRKEGDWRSEKKGEHGRAKEMEKQGGAGSSRATETWSKLRRVEAKSAELSERSQSMEAKDTILRHKERSSGRKQTVDADEDHDRLGHSTWNVLQRLNKD